MSGEKLTDKEKAMLYAEWNHKACKGSCKNNGNLFAYEEQGWWYVKCSGIGCRYILSWPIDSESTWYIPPTGKV